MATFSTSNGFSMSELDEYGYVVVPDGLDNDGKTSRVGLNLERMIEEIAEGIINVKRKGNRFLAPQQLSISVDYTYDKYAPMNGRASDNGIVADLDLWGNFQWKRPKTRMNNYNDIQGEFDELDWYNPKSDYFKYPDDTSPQGGFQIFGLKPISVNKLLKAKSAKKRFSLFTKGDDTIWGSSHGKNVLNGGKGDDWISCRSTDTIIGGQGKDTIYIDNHTIFEEINEGEKRDYTSPDFTGSIPTIKDFNAKQDKIEIPSSHWANTDMKLKLHESSKGSYLTYEYTYEIAYRDYGGELIYTGKNATNRYFFADLVGVNANEKIAVDFVEAPFNPYEGVI